MAVDKFGAVFLEQIIFVDNIIYKTSNSVRSNGELCFGCFRSCSGHSAIDFGGHLAT